MTWENLSISRYLSTSTVPNPDTFPMSFLPRSTSMLCSASSFWSESRSLSNSASSSEVEPLGLVPARGKVCRTPSLSFTRVSGDAPATSMSLPEK